MPSASEKLEKVASFDVLDPMKQAITIVEKRVRNLEKRKVKLESYRNDSNINKELNKDQKIAVEKYDQVVEVIEFAKELLKQFQNVLQENAKLRKKAARREQLERQHHELRRIKQIMLYQDLLNSMGGDDIRQDFLNGTNGAVKLTEEELNCLDELYKAISPERETASENSSDFDKLISTAAEHIQALMDCKNKEVFGISYKSLNAILQKIISCNYFNKSMNDLQSQSEVEQNTSLSEETDKDGKIAEPQQYSEANTSSVVEDNLMIQQSGLVASQTERPYYQLESPKSYAEQSHPIQEVLFVQENLNFLQESQIEVESSGICTQHCSQRPIEVLEKVVLSILPETSNVLPASSTAVQQQVGKGISATGSLVSQQPTGFDPSRPIPTQTYTNQSFSSTIHPVMAAAAASASQNYVPVTLSHSLASSHVLPSKMGVQPLPRNTVTPLSMQSNPNTLQIAPASGNQTSELKSTTFPQVKFLSSDLVKNLSHAYLKSESMCQRKKLEDNCGVAGKNELQQMNLNHNNAQSLNISSQYDRRDIQKGLRTGGVSRAATDPRGSRTGYRH